jgi:hypothetical protein
MLQMAGTLAQKQPPVCGMPLRCTGRKYGCANRAYLIAHISSASLEMQATALTGLRELHLSGNVPMGHLGPAAFETLPHLAALTFLDIQDCDLEALPPQLPALTQLQELHFGFGEPVEGSFLGALEGLAALKRVRVAGYAALNLADLRALQARGVSVLGRG